MKGALEEGTRLPACVFGFGDDGSLVSADVVVGVDFVVFFVPDDNVGVAYDVAGEVATRLVELIEATDWEPESLEDSGHLLFVETLIGVPSVRGRAAVFESPFRIELIEEFIELFEGHGIILDLGER